MHKKFILTLSSLGLAAIGLTGQITLAQWTFASNLNATTTAANVTASAVGFTFSQSAGGHSGSKGIDLDGSSYVGGNPIDNTIEANWTGANGRMFGRMFNDINTTAFAFNITVADGFQLDLTNVWADIGTRARGPDTISFQYSTAADFSNPVLIGGGSGFVGSSQTGFGYGAGGTLGVVAPTGGAFSWNRFDNTDNLGGNEALTGTVFFRIYASGATGTDNADANLFLDNLTIIGDVSVIPEPSTYAAMFGLLALGFVFWRRRRS